MQGYIIWIQKQKSEDLIIQILTPTELKTLYRFYGARHSIIHLGRKIDFTQEHNGIFMPKLRNIMHLGFSWEREAERLYVWQRFTLLLHRHLRDISVIDEEYFRILDSGAHRLSSQNPKRVALEMYAQILQLEGRNPLSQRCIICERGFGEEGDSSVRESIQQGFLDIGADSGARDRARETALLIPHANTPIRVLHAFVSAHVECATGEILPYGKLESYLRSASTITLDDEEIERAYRVLLCGM